MRREDILPNFEKMELMVIVDFHYFNLLFAKEDLMLNNRKTAILLNLLWELLIHNNSGYHRGSDESLQQGIASIDTSLLDQKTVESDAQHFKSMLLRHSCGKTEEELYEFDIKTNVPQMKVFSTEQVKQIVKYAYQSYFDKFNLYKYVFENKKKNEEVKLIVTISEPVRVPPLKEALYMGNDLRPVIIEEDLTPALSPRQSAADHSHHDNADQGQDEELRQSPSSRPILSPKQSISRGKADHSEDILDPDAELVDKRFEFVKSEFESTLLKNDQQIDEKISNKGKKKK